jgi:small subunit ribosomal protein S16
MAVKIRLKRTGRTHLPTYRIVVADSRSPRDGRFIEELGNYEQTYNPVKVTINEEKALNWLEKGDQPTDTVRNLFQAQGIMKKFADKKLGK